MHQITTQIEISAPPSKVWAILSDIGAWAQWSPIIHASTGRAAVGEKLSITMCGEKAGEKGPKYDPVITHVAAPTLLRWRAHMLASFIFTNEKILELEATPSGTRLTHTETFSGLMATMMRGRLDKGVPPMLTSMNEALKSKAEA